jgi:hypothetical protein
MSKKLFGLVARPDDMQPQAFHDHYRHPHGTMGLRISTLRSYVQSHQIDCEFLDASQRRFEAIAELWFDNEADVVHFRSEPVMAGYLNDDERHFMNAKASKHFIGVEEVLQSGPGEHGAGNNADAAWRLDNRPLSIKLMQFFPTDGGPAWCGENDASLGNRLGAFRHVRCHPTVPPSLGRRDRRPDFAGVRELWWPTLSAFNRAVQTAPDAWSHLMAGDGVHTVLVQAERFR